MDWYVHSCAWSTGQRQAGEKPGHSVLGVAPVQQVGSVVTSEKVLGGPLTLFPAAEGSLGLHTTAMVRALLATPPAVAVLCGHADRGLIPTCLF